jgi:hypothetical protein
VCDGQDSCLGDQLNDQDSDGLCSFEDSCPLDGVSDGDDSDSDGVCASDDQCADDPLNDADSDVVCDGADSCPGTALGDADGDGVCGDRACYNIQHYLELADCDVVFGDVNLTVPLQSLANDSSPVVAVHLPRLVVGSVHLHYECLLWEGGDSSGGGGGLLCPQGSFAARGSTVLGSMTLTGAVTNVTVERVNVSGALAVECVQNVSMASIEIANATVEQLRVAAVRVGDELALLRVVGVNAKGDGGISVAGLQFQRGDDVAVTVRACVRLWACGRVRTCVRRFADGRCGLFFKA